MVKRTIGLLFLVVITAMISGCGTLANTMWFIEEEGGMRVYGGVRADWDIAKGAIQDHINGEGEGHLSTVAHASLDMPFSLVGDTLTLPVTVPMAIKRGLKSQHAQAIEHADIPNRPLTRGPTHEVITYP